MKELVVVSGKGGTGKTSMTASLAVLAQRSVLADCDVDAADLHLVLNPKIQEKHIFMSGNEAIIDQDKCTSCGLCEELCRFDAIEFKDGKYVVKDFACEGCKVCVQACPENAIDFPAAHCGEWYSSTTKYGPMTHAALRAGAENSGKLVGTVRVESKKVADAIDQKDLPDWMIIDGPPGIGCSVIASITGVDAVLTVSEPTLSGMHDLERILGLAKHFDIPSYVVINKANLNQEINEKIKQMAKEFSSPVLGEIKYSKLFTQAQSKRMSLIEYAPESEEALEIKKIWKLLNELNPN